MVVFLLVASTLFGPMLAAASATTTTATPSASSVDAFLLKDEDEYYSAISSYSGFLRMRTSRRRRRELPTTTSTELLYLNNSKAYNWLVESSSSSPSNYAGDFYAMQKGCDAQVNQAYCSAASTACVLNSLVDDDDLPVDPAYAPYKYATDVDLLSNNDNELVGLGGRVEKNCVNETVVQVNDEFNGVLMFPYGLVLEQASKLVECYVNPDEYRVRFVHVDESVTVDQVRDDLRQVLAQKNGRIFMNFFRSGLGQVGGGHFSPVVAYSSEHDSFLVYDVAKYKFPPVWAPSANMHAAMNTVDSCGSWDFPGRQLAVNKTVLDMINTPPQNRSAAAANAEAALACQPAFRGYVVVEPADGRNQSWPSSSSGPAVEGVNGQKETKDETTSSGGVGTQFRSFAFWNLAILFILLSKLYD